VVSALQATAKGGSVVSGGIHMSDIPRFPYRLLWEERVVRSVANLTREDGREFMELVGRTPIETSVQVFGLEEANVALDRLRGGKVRGAAVLVMQR
jgi:propanol-preferring alcohol dehydrogenase